jgi:type IV fimbrial biogenesis protein FimT
MLTLSRKGLDRSTNINSAQGLSLIEVMVTVAIMALLMAAAVPSMGEWIANVRLRGAAEVAISGLQKARAEAIKSNQVVGFWLVSPATAVELDNTCALSSSSPSWVISLNDPTGACLGPPVINTAPGIIESHGAGKTASGTNVSALSGTNEAATQVKFNGFGRRPAATPDSDIRTIDFTSTTTGARRLRIEISTGGGVRMCDRDAPNTVPPDPKACLL